MVFNLTIITTYFIIINTHFLNNLKESMHFQCEKKLDQNWHQILFNSVQN